MEKKLEMKKKEKKKFKTFYWRKKTQICYVPLYRMFEQRCIALMNSMYNENTKHAIDLMDDEAHVWGIHSSPLTFAYENFMYDVVAHTSSQKNMNKLWYNKLPPDLKPFLKVETLTHPKVQMTIKCGFFFRMCFYFFFSLKQFFCCCLFTLVL